MHKHFLQEYPLKTFSKYFLKILKFSFRTKIFFFQNHPFQAPLLSKTYLFINVKKNLHKIERPLKRQFFFDAVLPNGNKENYIRSPKFFYIVSDIHRSEKASWTTYI